MALVAGVISLGPQPKAWDHDLPISAFYSWLLSTVPLFHALRVPARWGMLVSLAACMLAAIGTKRLLINAGNRVRLATTVLISAVIVFEGYGGPLRLREPDVLQTSAVARIGFTITNRSLRDYPREVESVATRFGATTEERVLYRGRILRGLARGFLRDPDRPIAIIDLSSYVSTRLVVRQVGHANPWFWSIDELSPWERAPRR